MNSSSLISQKILRGILSGAGLTVISILVAFVQFRLIIEYLPTGIAGVWFLFINIGAYIAFFDLGISPTVSREISFILGREHYNGNEKLTEIVDLIKTCLRIFQVLSLLVFLLGLLIGGIFLWKITPDGSQIEVGVAWAIFTFGAALNLLGGAAFSTLYGLGNVAVERTIRSITQLLGLGLSVVMLYLGFGIVGLAIAWTLQNLIARIIGWIVLFYYHPFLKTMRGTFSAENFRKIAMPSIKWAATSLGAILILQTGNIVIASMIGPSAIPPYEAVVKIITTLGNFAMLMVTSSTPFLSKAFAANDIQSFNTLLLRNVRYGMCFMIFFVSFLAVFGEEVINVWLGPNNFVGYPVMWTLLIMLTLEVHHVIHATVTMASGRIIFYWYALGSGILNIILSLILVKYVGILGVALGIMISQILTNNWYAPYMTLRLFKIPFKHYFQNILLPIIIYLATMITWNMILKVFVEKYLDILSIVIAAPLSFLLGAVISYILIFPKSDRDTIRKKLYNRKAVRTST